MKIKTTDNKGIHITCSDHTLFSLQFGAGNYCENKELSIIDQFRKKNDTSSHDCEVAVFDAAGEWITANFFKESDGQVAGYIDLEKALRIILEHESSLAVLKYIKED
jgi:hypothetical protein